MNTWSIFSNNTTLEVGVFCVSGTFALFALLLTAYLIFRHVKHWTDPEAQRAIVRILFLVPVYGIVSWLAIVFGDYALYFTLVRDCYEAYALYQFFCLLVHYLQEAMSAFMTLDEAFSTTDQLDPGELISTYGERRLAAPFCMFTYQPGKRVFVHIKRCSLQYVFVKPTLTAVAILLQMLGKYHEGSLSIRYGFLWITLMLNISAALAFYFIFLFYELIKHSIFMYHPLLKLISIKILVFFIFWQSMILAILYHFHVIPGFFGWSVERSSSTAQNMLICLEMVCLSIFNFQAFPYAEYRSPTGENSYEIALETLSSVVSQKDIVKDTKEVFITPHKHFFERGEKTKDEHTD